MKTPAPPLPLARPAVRFRDMIEKAEAGGAIREAMILRLTHGDVSWLKRDQGLGVSDISFEADGMRFLGVKVEEGGVAKSELVPSS